MEHLRNCRQGNGYREPSRGILARRGPRFRAASIGVAAIGMMLSASAADGQQPTAGAGGMGGYRCERSRLNYLDLLTLDDGTMRVGKALEWGDQILLFDGSGAATAFDVVKVAELEFRRFYRHRLQPKLPDLTVAYVERLPRDPHWHGRVRLDDGLPRVDDDGGEATWHPAAGDRVTFRVFVLNAGSEASREVAGEARIGDELIGQFTVPALLPGARHTAEVAWRWNPAAGGLRIIVDPEGAAPDALRWNNEAVEPVDAWAVTVAVARDRYEAFGRHANMVDSFCFEDYVRHHVASFNALLAASVYPSAPNGALVRLRCDRIVVVDDPYDASLAAEWRGSLHRGGSISGVAEHAALMTFGRLGDDVVFPSDALKMDWAALHEVGRQLGLIDPAVTDTTLERCLARDRFGRYAQRRYAFSRPDEFMYTPNGRRLSESSVNFLNYTKDRPRGLGGDYLYQLPARITLEVLSNSGRPLPNVQIDAYQLQGDGDYAGYIAGAGRGDPLYSAPSDSAGRFTLPDQDAPAHQTPSGYALRPNPFGKIAVDGSNGLLLFKLESAESESYFFLTLLDAHEAFLQGHRDEWVVEMRTPFGDGGAPPPPNSTAMIMQDRSEPMLPVDATWSVPPRFPRAQIDEFRVYQRSGFGGEESRPWRVVGVSRREPEGWYLKQWVDYFRAFRSDGDYSPDTFVAVSTVDHDGREGGLSGPGYLAYDKTAGKLAITGMAAFMTLGGDGPCQMLRWDGMFGTHPFGVRSTAFRGYRPTFGGIAVGADRRLIVTDPANHVLCLYSDRGDLEAVIPRRPWWPGYASDDDGEFFAPMDVAVDALGRIYVADTGNNRVQILDAAGGFAGLLDAKFAFVGPHALGLANGHLCVTDQAGTRCRVYDVSEFAPSFVRQLPPLVDADRGLVSRSGRVYITGRLAEAMDSGIMVFSPDGDGAMYEETHNEVEMGKVYDPRGLYFYVNALDEDYGYCLNAFPFDVRRVKMN
jgi:hypothetical protein